MREFYKKNPPRMIFYVVLILVIGLTATAIGVQSLRDKDLLVRIGSEKISKTEFERILKIYQKDGKQLSAEEKRSVLNTMVETEVLRQEAKKAGITLTEEEKENEYDNLVNKITDKFVAIKTGQVALARFDRFYEVDIDNAEQNTPAEKEYAKAKIDALAADLKSGKITFKQLMDSLDNDSRIGKPAWNTKNYSFSFDLTEKIYRDKGVLSSSKDLWKALEAQQKGTSKVRVFKTTKHPKDKAEEVESFYAIINIENVKAGSASYKDWLDAKLNEYQINLNKVEL